MEGYYREILKKFIYDDDIDSYQELFDLIQENNIGTAEDDFIELATVNTNNCSLLTTTPIVLPTPMGTNFLSNFNPIQAMNTVIPDIFRFCIMINPNVYSNPAPSTRSFPQIRISYEDTSFGEGAESITRYQKILPINIIKALLYFGYKSNFTLADNDPIDFLEKKIENIVKISVSTNSSFTDANTIFDEIYNQDTLIQQIIQLNNLMDKVKKEDTDYTNIGNYNLPYLFSYYCLAKVTPDFNVINKKYSNFRDQNTSALSYCDIVYLNYLKKLVKDDLTLDNFLLLLNNNIIGNRLEPNVIENLTNIISFVKKNNIFNIIDLALEVKTYILNIITYNLNKKVYKIESYAKPTYLLLTRKFYCIYAKNSNYNYPELELPNFCNDVDLN